MTTGKSVGTKPWNRGAPGTTAGAIGEERAPSFNSKQDPEDAQSPQLNLSSMLEKEAAQAGFKENASHQESVQRQEQGSDVPDQELVDVDPAARESSTKPASVLTVFLKRSQSRTGGRDEDREAGQ